MNARSQDAEPWALPRIPTEPELVEAAAGWGLNCGPAALCAVLGLTPAEVRPHLGDFERRLHMNPTAMADALRSLGRSFRVVYREHDESDDGGLEVIAPFPRLGLLRVQWAGPWTRRGVPVRARYGQTHWLATASVPPLGYQAAWDVNTCDQGWVPYLAWAQRVAPVLAKDRRRADGRWWITHAWEIA